MILELEPKLQIFSFSFMSPFSSNEFYSTNVSVNYFSLNQVGDVQDSVFCIELVERFRRGIIRILITNFGFDRADEKLQEVCLPSPWEN